ncbi:sirohydrochlorin chelatase [Thioflexithrix psekupsensis]|uniref:Cobalamin biosynthesis protein CbiX n=1 Tax=Thioflexithrix psekupsensis TaxID=1570016 RepID=A0A251X5X9_9GAMM|nr:CbiX/SirB N-terminal domain-containing protein [Thioflexithrix psekupsensis]OUD13063.1 cobalamin biosynthesis protein CbiX [Thioflexithrix psekupsensis]
MKSLLLIAHGSRRELSNQEVRQLTDQLRIQAGTEFKQVSCAFLELAEPSIEAEIDHCVQQGCSELFILPYFLSAGRHVSEDIPQAIARKQADYPDLRVVVLPYLGASPQLVQVLLHQLNDS